MSTMAEWMAEEAAKKAAWIARDTAERANPALKSERLAREAAERDAAKAELSKPLPEGDPYSDVVLTERLRRAHMKDRATAEVSECEALLSVPFERRRAVSQLASYLTNTTPGLRWSDAMYRAASAPQAVYDNADRHMRHVAEYEDAMRWADEDGSRLRKVHHDALYVER